MVGPRFVESAADLVGYLNGLPDLHTGEVFCYRGEGDSSWPLAPRLLRPESSALLANERDAVRELLAVKPEDFASDTSMFDRLVRMQHFGLPTRLLDVTLNPLVALYNATEPKEPAVDGRVYYFRIPRVRKKYFDSDTVSCIANLANMADAEKTQIGKDIFVINKTSFNKRAAVERLLQFVRAEKPHFKARINPIDLMTLWFVVPKLSNPRIIAQRGAFVIYGLSRPAGESTGVKPMTRKEWIIPHAKKKDIRIELAKLGITAAGLFPEIERAASHVIDQLG